MTFNYMNLQMLFLFIYLFLTKMLISDLIIAIAVVSQLYQSYRLFEIVYHGKVLIMWFLIRSSMAVSKLEPELRESIASQYGDRVRFVYFNKGL